MPCYKGIAVSIHAKGPLPEYGVVKQSRVSRVTSYIPVPEPTLDGDSGAQEPAKFAISITLLTKNLAIPYSAPKPSESNPNPRPQMVGLPGPNGAVVSPYIPLTTSENETIAAYIYFDGRAKEEVATLLRPGEETWVNSRWVQVPESEGGGLAEREFLFREVALERWLNGLDLQGHDAADKLEKRRQKFEKKQRRQERLAAASKTGLAAVDIVESDDDGSSVSSDDELPESTGQIKVAMFRVLASGEIKKGEYSPQFDAHDDDDDSDPGKQNGGGVGADVEHTTSFAKPKTLDPKTISTQTVTGIDGPEKPYATFTFFYRGKRQLEKMGVLPSSRSQATPSSSAKRRSTQLELPKLGPLKTTGTVGFSAFRDNEAESTRRRKSRKKVISGSPGVVEMDEFSDSEDDEGPTKMEDIDEKDTVDPDSLDPDESKFSGELADGVERIHLKRARSADPDSAAAANAASNGPRKSPRASPPAAGHGTPPEASKFLGVEGTAPGPSGAGLGLKTTGLNNNNSSSLFGAKSTPDESVVGSPLKKHRPSIHDEESLSRAVGLGSVLAQATAGGLIPPVQAPALPQPTSHIKEEDEDEEL